MVTNFFKLLLSFIVVMWLWTESAGLMTSSSDVGVVLGFLGYGVCALAVTYVVLKTIKFFKGEY